MPLKFHMKRLLPGLKSLDMFGVVPELNYNGEPAFTTYLGSIVSLIMFGLMRSVLFGDTLLYVDHLHQD